LVDEAKSVAMLYGGPEPTAKAGWETIKLGDNYSIWKLRQPQLGAKGAIETLISFSRSQEFPNNLLLLITAGRLAQHIGDTGSFKLVRNLYCAEPTKRAEVNAYLERNVKEYRMLEEAKCSP
jgi:hypothetical protein